VWPSAPVIVSVLVLAVVCSALAFILMVALIGEVGPVKATAITYINPAVAIAAGVLILGEPFTIWTFVGFVLVLSGSYLVARRRRDAVAPAGPEEAVAEEVAIEEVSSGEAKPAPPS
jgi:drug/metabolite transporter (DMT)-like permease